MANKEINELTAASTPLDGTELVHIEQSGNSRKVAVSQFSGRLLFVLEDQKASGTNGGDSTFGGGWQIREINAEAYNPDSIVTVSSNQFTPTVDCCIEWSCPAYKAGSHQTIIYNVTDSVEAGRGTSEFTAANDNTQTRSFGSAIVTAGKSYRIDHYIQNGTTNGLGRAVGQGTEVYTVVKGYSI